MSWFCVIHSIYLVSSIFVSVKIEYDTPLIEKSKGMDNN